jgi:hypothetical protein
MTIQASLAGEHREATAMFASKEGEWIPVPMGGGGGTPEPPRWVTVPNAFIGPPVRGPGRPLVGANLRATFEDGVFTVLHDAFTGAESGFDMFGERFHVGLADIPDLDDDTVVYRLMAEPLNIPTPTVFIGVFATTDVLDTTGAARELNSGISSVEPEVGQQWTLATSVQQQLPNTINRSDTPQLRRVMSGPNRGITVALQYMGPNGARPANSYSVRLWLEKLVGAPADDGGGDEIGRAHV